VKGRIIIAALVAAAGLAAVIPLANGASGERSRALFAYMNGRAEVDAEGNRNTGDRNGLGTFSAIVDSEQICFGITVRDIDDPVAAHIHRGGRNVAGPVVVTLTEPSNGNPGASSGCVPIQDRLAAQILRRPNRFYVNVHTGACQNGAVRGQLQAERR
jgi:CHRD domain